MASFTWLSPPDDDDRVLAYGMMFHRGVARDVPDGHPRIHKLRANQMFIENIAGPTPLATLQAMTIPQLQALAASKSISLVGALTKAAIIALIVAAGG